MFENKRIIKLSGVIIFFIALLFIPFNLNESPKKTTEPLTNEAKLLLEQNNDSVNSNVVYADGKKPDSNVWTMYAQIVMGEKSVEEDAKGTGQTKLLGHGGVSADFPYTDISKNGNKMTGDKAGTQLSAFLATYSYYGYIETVSGNAIATGVTSFLGGIGRFVGSLIAGIAEGISAIAEGINNILATLFMSLNPLALLGFGEDNIAENPISKALTLLLSNLGLNNAFFKALASLSLVIFTAVLAIKLINMLSKEGLNTGLWKPIRDWTVRILVLGICLPLMGMFLTMVIKEVQSAKKDGNLTTSVVASYIINTRLWAATQNLAPDSRIGAGLLPSADYSSDQKFIDPDYEPSRQKTLIETINSMSYASYGGTGGSLNPNAIGMALLKEWSSNETFNVNTYAGDVNISKNDDYMSGIPSVRPDSNEGLTAPENLGGYVWSASQNVTDDNRLPNGKGDETEFDSSKKWGVENNATFSTQSVALLLQSEINSSGTKFYSYNLAPSGVQGSAKNMSTVKTEWRTASLVGHGALGKFGSWLAMVTESLVQGVYYLACAWALFTISLIDVLKKAFKRVMQVAVFASIPASVGLLTISLALIVVALMAMSLPSVLLSISRAFSDTAIGLIPSNMLMDGIQNLITAVFSLAVCWVIAFSSKSRPVSIVQTIMSLPLELATAFDKRASLVFGSGNDVVRMADSISQAMNANRGGANNPYYQGQESNGSVKDVVTEALVGVGASKLADKLNETGQSDNQINPESAKSRDFVEGYKSDYLTDSLGRLVNENGDFVDQNGELLKSGNYGMDADGRRIDEYGRLVDEYGNLIDQEGNILENETSGMDINGNKVDEYGRLVDEYGNLIDQEGNRVLDGDIGVDGEGRLVDNLGRLVNEDGNLVDENGDELQEGKNGFTVGGAIINEEGEIVEGTSARKIVSTVGDTDGYEEYDVEANDSKQQNISEEEKTSHTSNLLNKQGIRTVEAEFNNKGVDGINTAKESLENRTKEPDKKRQEESQNKNKSTTSPLMKKVATGTKITMAKVDKALAQAPKGSLASMTYATKESVGKVATGAKNIVKRKTKKETNKETNKEE